MIIRIILIWISMFFIGCAIGRIIHNVRRERANKAFANLPNEVLLHHALVDPILRTRYELYRVRMTDEAATDLIVNNLLIKMGLIGYRKAES